MSQIVVVGPQTTDILEVEVSDKVLNVCGAEAQGPLTSMDTQGN